MKFYDVTWGGKFVAVGEDGTTRVSTTTTGSSWSSATTIPSVTFLSSVTYGGGNYLTIDTADDQIYQSSNGTSWSLATTEPSLYIKELVYANGYYVSLGGEVAYASTPTSWTEADDPGLYNLQNLIYAGGMYVAVGDNGTIFYSSNITSTNWTKVDIGSADYYGIAYSP